MKKLCLLLVLVLILAIAVQPVAAITWGELDTQHSNVGAMVVDWPGYGPWQFCTGTLIHPRVFLTAGHCTDALAAYGITRVWVNFDQYALNPATMLDVSQVITHPDYNWGPQADPHDVAVLILAKPAPRGIVPAALPSEGLLDDLRAAGELRQGSDGAHIVVVGYGVQEPPGFAADDLRRVAVSEYITLLGAWVLMSQNRALDDSGTCYGDSGGPGFLVLDGQEVLIGITSWGDAQCRATGFDYRVDIPETLSFIQDVIAHLR